MVESHRRDGTCTWIRPSDDVQADDLPVDDANATPVNGDKVTNDDDVYC